MSNLNISATLAPADKVLLSDKALEIRTILVFLINLDPAKRKSLRKMATKRAGYVLDVLSAVLANPSAIPTTFSIDEFSKDKALFDDLAFIYNLYRPIIEGIEDTMLALGNELMTQSDTCYTYLKRAAKDNANLTEVVDRIGTAFNQSASKVATTFSIAASGSIVIENVMPESRLVNGGTTIIKVKYSPAVEVTVDPGNSELIPAGVKSITVENLSTTVLGSVRVMIK